MEALQKAPLLVATVCHAVGGTFCPLTLQADHPSSEGNSLEVPRDTPRLPPVAAVKTSSAFDAEAPSQKRCLVREVTEETAVSASKRRADEGVTSSLSCQVAQNGITNAVTPLLNATVKGAQVRNGAAPSLPRERAQAQQ